MSHIRTDEFTYNCGNDHGLTEPCDGHTIHIDACLNSDTVAIYLDGEPTVLSDAGYWALHDAMAQLDARWSSK